MIEAFALRRIIFTAVMSALVWQSLPAYAQSARDLDDRIRKLEQQIQTLASNRGVTSQALPGAGNEEAANVQARVIKLEQLVEQLTGQIEEARFKTGQMSTQLEQLSNDVNYRLAVLEQSLGTQSGAVPNQMPPPPRPGAPSPLQPFNRPWAMIPMFCRARCRSRHLPRVPKRPPARHP